MLAIIGVLILLGMLSIVGYNRLTGLYNQAIEARRFPANADAPRPALPSATDAQSAAEAYDAARHAFPLSLIARIGGFGDLPEVQPDDAQGHTSV